VAEEFKRQVIVYGKHFWSFYNLQRAEVQEKIDWVIGFIISVPIVPDKFLKHLEGTKGLYEVRVRVGSDIFRLLCCFDGGRLIILFNGFQKKSEKTPKREIKKATRLKQQYYEDKESTKASKLG
jgi:phage-related protein